MASATTILPDPRADLAAAPLQLAVVVPTFNEQANVRPLLERLEAALQGIAWEVIFVDDHSPDGTAAAVWEVARADRRVRCLQRRGRRGLASACIEGALATAAPVVAVIDGDLQHDERLLPRMLEAIEAESLDLVVGSRHVDGGGVGAWDESRQLLSRLATRLSRLVVPPELTDPMSGFFMLRRDALERALPGLSQQGFKILLDLFASSPRPLRFRELGYRFHPRQHGESKLDTLVAWEYAALLLDKLVGRVVPVRFLLFSLVGGFGVFVHMAVLALAHLAFGWAFAAAQGTATLTAMVLNFFLNNLLTYRDRRLKGWRILGGLASFMAICSVGAVANVGVGAYLFGLREIWWLAGLAGVLVGAVWNYAVSAVFTWRSK